MADTCRWGHDTTKPNSRDAGGFCRQCRRERNQREYQKLRAAEAVVDIFTAAGAVYQDGDRPVSPKELVEQLVKLQLPE